MTELAQRNPQQELVAQVRGEDFKQQIALALPEGVPAERFIRVTITALMQNADLITADRDSLLYSVLKCAQDGLMPDGRQAALVIFKGKVQYIPMITGVRYLAAGFGWTINTKCVYANDTFEVYEGSENRIVHRQPSAGTDRGELVAAYARCTHRDGREPIFKVMYADDIKKVRAVARTQTVWNQWEAQMWEKSVGHAAYKQLPLDPHDAERLSRVLEASALEPGGASELLYGPTGERLMARAVSEFAEQPAGVVEVVPVEVSDVEDSPGLSPADDTIAPSGLLDGGSREEVEARSPGSDDSSPDVSTSQPDPAEAPGLDEEAEMLALNAADFVPPSGKFSAGEVEGPKTLAEIYALGDEGRKYLTMCLRKLGDGEWRVQTELFCRVSMPEVYQQVMAERALA